MKVIYVLYREPLKYDREHLKLIWIIQTNRFVHKRYLKAPISSPNQIHQFPNRSNSTLIDRIATAKHKLFIKYWNNEQYHIM